MHVVLVEDNAVLALLAEEALTAADHVVVASTDAEDDAVHIVLQLRPDLVLLDLRLSKGSGSRALRRIRRLADVPCLLVTADAKQARQLTDECVGILHKPFDMPTLVEAVDALDRLMRGEDPPHRLPKGFDLFLRDERRV